jgi:hypothetical protein
MKYPFQNGTGISFVHQGEEKGASRMRASDHSVCSVQAFRRSEKDSPWRYEYERVGRLMYSDAYWSRMIRQVVGRTRSLPRGILFGISILDRALYKQGQSGRELLQAIKALLLQAVAAFLS